MFITCIKGQRYEAAVHSRYAHLYMVVSHDLQKTIVDEIERR